MKKTIIFSIIVLGLSSIIGQLILIRELTISFFGNEFFIGWILFSWLFWVGIGSLFLNKIFTTTPKFGVVVVCQILIAIFLPLEIFLARFSRTILAGPTGQIPNLLPAILYSFFILAPLCLILGLQFNIISRFWKSVFPKNELSQILGKAYLLEALGFIFGGLVFSYVLIFINEFQAASILAFINLLGCLFIVFLNKKQNPILKLVVIILIIFFVGILIFSKDINNKTNTLRYPNQKLIEVKNSLYGNIAVSQTKDQYNLYESGLLVETSKEEFSTEEIAHFSLLFHRDPQKLLLIGNGINGTLKEILKHWPNKVFYLELDPMMIDLAKKYASLENQDILKDETIKIISADARNYFKKNPNLFDAIIISLPNPSTALINRFYTEDFFKEIKHHLYAGGIFAIKLSLSPNYFGPEIENLDASIFKALEKVFPSVLILPEDNHLFISSLDKIDYDYWPLFSRIIIRNIKTNFINEAYLKYRLNNDRIKTLLSGLENNRAQINQDQKPIGYYYNFVYWTSIFYPKLAKFLQVLTKIKFWWVIIFIIILGFWVLTLSGFRARSGHGLPDRVGEERERDPEAASLGRPKKAWGNAQNLLPIVMAVAGFSLMATEIIIIFGFQVFYGYLYYKISLIITFLMAGMALGAWLAMKKIKSKINYLIIIQSLIVIFFLLILVGFYLLFENPPKPSLLIEIIFLISVALIGGLVGFEFPIINKLYLENKNDTRKTGIIYGVDLIGSCLGASLISIFFIPIFGIFQTIIFIAIINFVILISLTYFTSFSSKT